MVEYQFPKASIQHRLGGKAVDAAMYLVTFGIGWWIWSLVIWGQGQTPGKQIVKLRVFNKVNQRPVTWGHMALREFVLPLSLTVWFWIAVGVGSTDESLNTDNEFILFSGVLAFAALIVGLLDIFWIFKNDQRNRLVDVIAKTDVLNESSLGGLK